MRLINPLLAVSSYVTWMTQTLFWSLVQFNVFSFFSRKSQVFAADASTDKNYCTASINYYKANVMNNPYTKKSVCKDDCLGDFYVAPVFKSNLRLVIQKKCGCEAKKQTEWNKKLEVESSFITPTSHYRKLPQLKCYAYSDEESKECGSGCSLSPIKLLIIGLTLVYSLLAH
ncbi:uncharacterized protein LOC114574312 [Exaiptasia diaphana]|uniref:Uncharacterized protein n=1 Tax=Exaiptasia diaphana TaxID=2652724 RepID=A0A913YPP5_EXADI|nr:uncharacterized protein LOC114574312 [Exaiptasia diaphana]